MKREFLFLISPQYTGELLFEDIVNLCLLRVSEVKLSLDEELNEIAEKIDPTNTLSGEEIKKYKKEITDKMKVKMLQNGSLECRLELDI
jgi:hypothetical protein